MVKLGAVGLSRTYRRSLKEAGQRMLVVVESLGGNLRLSSAPQVVDQWLERAVNECYKRGERIHWVVLGVLGIQKGFKLSGPLLRGTWSAVRGWRQLLPTRSRVPITRYCLDAVLLVLLAEGRQVQGRERYVCWASALACWLSFACMLRPGELLNLKVGDLCFPEREELGVTDAGLVVVVREPKTRRIWKNQFVLTHDLSLVRWLRWWVTGLARRAPLFHLSRYLWDARFRSACSRLCISSCNFTLGSFRSGGATYLFRKDQNLGALQFAGRWKSASTLQHYLHTAFSAHVMGNLNSEARQKLDLTLQHAELLQSPPCSSLSNLLRRGQHGPTSH